MKKINLSALALAFVFVACNSNSDNAKETTTKQTTVDTNQKETTKPIPEQLYSCSMHPEVIGKKDENCSKCGMKLTVPVKN